MTGLIGLAEVNQVVERVAAKQSASAIKSVSDQSGRRLDGGRNALLCCTIAVSLLTLACAQPAPREGDIAFPFAPPSGVTWRVTEHRVTTTIRAGQTTEQAVDSTGSLSIMATAMSSTTMEWTMLTSTSGGAPTDPDATEGLVGSTIRFQTDAGGNPTRIESVTLAQSSSVAGPTTGRISRGSLDRVLQGTDPETLTLMFLPQVAAISSCQNFKFGPEHSLTRQGESPGIGAGSPITFDVVVVLESPGSASKPARVRMTQSFDPVSAAASFSQAYQAAGRLPANGAGLSPMTRETVTNCEIDIATGTATRVSVETTVRMDDVELRETREITLARTG